MVNSLQVWIKTAAISGIGLLWANFTIEAFKFARHIISTSPGQETSKIFFTAVCENCQEHFLADGNEVINGPFFLVRLAG